MTTNNSSLGKYDPRNADKRTDFCDECGREFPDHAPQCGERPITVEDYISQTEFHNVQRYVIERAARALMSAEGFPRNSAFTSNKVEAIALIRGVTGASLAVAREILQSILSQG